MSLDEKIGQLLFATYHGSLDGHDTAAYSKIMHDVTDLHIVASLTYAWIAIGIVKSQAYPRRSEQPAPG